jgi:hypothetical protein
MPLNPLVLKALKGPIGLAGWASAHVARRRQSRNAGLEPGWRNGKVSRHHLIPVIESACIPVIEPACRAAGEAALPAVVDR